jgi:glycosyltransferase involved in cell wall biosynthesis
MRLAIIVSHPIQYYSPWFRHVAESMEHGAWSVEPAGGTKGLKDEPPKSEVSDRNAIRVFYLWDFGVTEKQDKGFGQAVKWDVDLLEGYDHEFVPNVSKRPGTDWFGGLDNPELLQRVKAFAPDAVLQFGYNYKSLVNFDLRWNTKRAPLLFRGDSHLLAEGREESLQSSVFSFQREKMKKWVRQVGLRLLLKRFACFLAVGKANADYFRAHGVPESKIVFCPHVVDNAFFLERRSASVQSSAGSVQPELKERGLRAELGIPEDELVFLFAGKLEEKKQPLLLLEAFLRADLPKSTLLFVGSGELEGALRARVNAGHGFTRMDADGVRAAAPTGLKEECSAPSDLGARKSPPEKSDDCQRTTANSRLKVHFLAFQNQSQMPLVYRTGDLLVLPSKGRYETWGLAVNEAACCGLPAIVSSHVGCGPDLVEDGVTGWIFEAGNVAALQRALEAAAANRGRLAAMGEALKQRVTSDYSYQSATEALLAELDNLKP